MSRNIEYIEKREVSHPTGFLHAPAYIDRGNTCRLNPYRSLFLRSLCGSVFLPFTLTDILGGSLGQHYPMTFMAGWILVSLILAQHSSQHACWCLTPSLHSWVPGTDWKLSNFYGHVCHFVVKKVKGSYKSSKPKDWEGERQPCSRGSAVAKITLQDWRFDWEAQLSFHTEYKWLTVGK